MDKFVDEWNIIQTLGEGAYGEVKLLVHQKSGEAVAMKVVNLRKCKDAKISVLKEEKIHRLMMHGNIIKLLGKREEPNMVYIFLEYAAGGELFNRIEPDVGMYPGHAQKYMKQLLSGLDYLHSKGIAHRDIKPENLLLDECGILKISDFGLATIFRLKGKERLLDKKCGTLPYVAPEVLEKPYRAQPTDLWSCGIVFVAMLAGELPWDEPRSTCKEYVQWKTERCITQTPWSKLGNNALSLAIKVLSPEPTERFTLQQIEAHPWMNMRFPNADYDDAEDDDDEADTKEPAAKRNPSISELGSVQKMPAVTLSQPTVRPKMLAIEPRHLAALTNKDKICFSQPAQNVEDLLISSQIQCTQSPLTQNNFEKLVKRMTRIFVKTPYEKTIAHLCKALDILYLSWTTDPSGVVSISTTDARKMPLEFKANIIDMDCKLLLDFRLAKGCGLEFKRLFMKIKKLLSDIAES